MTTVTLTVDDELLEKAKAGLEQRGLTLDDLRERNASVHTKVS